MKLPSIPLRDDLAAQTSQYPGADRLPGLPDLFRPAEDDGASIDVGAGPQITGTTLAWTLTAAFAVRPCTRSARSLLVGVGFLRTGLRLGGRERRQPKNHGFAIETTGATGVPGLGVIELIHTHGRRFPNLMRNASYRVIKRDVRAVTDHESAIGSLH